MRKSALLLVGIFLFSFIFLSQNAYAWWRKEIDISNPTANNMFHTVKIYLSFDSGKVANCTKEIRVTFNDTLTTEKEIWVNVSNETYSGGYCLGATITYDVYVSGTNTTWVYYGNSTATAVIRDMPLRGWNVTAEDDWEDGNSNGWAPFECVKWNTNGACSGTGSATVINGVYKLQTAPYQLDTVFSPLLNHNITLNKNYNITVRANTTNDGVELGRIIILTRYMNRSAFYGVTITTGWCLVERMTTSGATTVNSSSYTSIGNGWHNFSVVQSNSKIEAFVDGVSKCIAIDSTYAYGGVALATGNGGANYAYQSYYDSISIVSYPSSTISIGAEELLNQLPQYSNVLVSPSSPQTYGINDIWFNITWTDDNGLDKAWINHNFTGTSQNYLMSNDSATHFYYHLTFTPAAGTYSYTFYANDTLGATNQTSTYSYIINKASTTIYLAINGTEADATYTYPAVTNATAWKTVDGGTLTLLRNGSSVSNPEIIQLAAGVYNYTATLDHQNYTASPVTRILTINKRNSQLSLIASPSWTINQQQSVTVTCSAISSLSVTLQKDGVTVSNPYVAILPTGFYTFSCTINDTANYTPSTTSNVLNVLIAGVGCYDNSTFAYYANIPISASQVVLNFTDFVNKKIVKPDLSDIYINSTNLTYYTNFTSSSSLLLVNSANVSSFTVYFGNYLISVPKTNASQTNSSITSFSYSQSSPYQYNINLLNEMTGSPLLPPNTNQTYATIYCSGGTTRFNVSTTQFLLAANDQLTQVGFTVQYSPTEIYYRDLLVNNPIENKNMYVVDANQYQVVQYLLQLQDNTGSFTSPQIHIRKQMGGQLETIAERNFDAENKAIVYLINGQQYQITVTSGSQIRTVGNIYADTVNLVKTIIIGQTTALNVSAANTTFNLTYNNATGTITFIWNDPASNTLSAEMWVYNYTNQSQLLFYTNSTNATSIVFNYMVPDINQTYLTTVEVHNTLFGTNSLSLTNIFCGIINLPPYLLPPLSVNTIAFISTLGLITLPMFFGPAFGSFAAIVTAIFALLIGFIFGYLIASIGIIVIVIVLAVLNKMTEKRTES